MQKFSTAFSFTSLPIGLRQVFSDNNNICKSLVYDTKLYQ